MKASSRFFLCVALAALWSCAGQVDEDLTSRTQGVFQGEIDADTAGVVFVATTNGGVCSGILMAPNLVLTARNCVAPISNGEAGISCGRSLFGPAIDPSTLRVGVTASLAPPQGESALEIVVPDDTGACGNDIAIIRLAGDIDATPLPLRLDAPTFAGEAFSLVGWGTDTAFMPGDPVPTTERRRRDGLSVTCVDCPVAAQAAPGEFVAEGAACAGDAGGPALDGQGEVIGFSVRGNGNCEGGGSDTYTAVAAWSDFVRDALEPAVPAVEDMGSTEPDLGSSEPDTGAAIDMGAPTVTTTDDGGCCATVNPTRRTPLVVLFLLFGAALVRRRG